MSNYVIQASPLSKIFIEEHQARCITDPAWLVSNAPFTVRVKRPTGSIEFEYKKPYIAASLISNTMRSQDPKERPYERQVIYDEVKPLVHWLTDDKNHETDIYGIVAIDIEGDVASAITAMVYDAKAVGNFDQIKMLITDIQKKMQHDFEKARELADARVLRQCDRMFKSVKDTVSFMKKEGKGAYSPSFSEALAASLIQKHYVSQRADEKKAAELFDRAFSGMEGVPLGSAESYDAAAIARAEQPGANA